MSQYTGLNHTYVICAYRESAYLEECILSLLSQAVPSHIIMATSTPNEFIRSLSDRYGIELYVNEGESGIAGDWNIALSCVKTEIATIAHQDDIYEPWYTQRILEGINRSRKPLILFTDYGELREGEKEDSNVLLNIKRFMLFPLRMRTVTGADKIIVLSDGHVAEQGRPEELYEKNGLYTHMVRLQTQSQRWTLET